MADKPKRPDILDFMKQFNENMNKQSEQTLREKMNQASTLAHLAELSSEGLLKELSEEWDQLGASATHLLVRAAVRENPSDDAIRALVIAAYRCDAMSRLFTFIREKMDHTMFEITDEHVAEARTAIDALLKLYRR